MNWDMAPQDACVLVANCLEFAEEHKHQTSQAKKGYKFPEDWADFHKNS